MNFLLGYEQITNKQKIEELINITIKQKIIKEEKKNESINSNRKIRFQFYLFIKSVKAVSSSFFSPF